MPRLARVVVPGYPHHITQRGNRRRPTFFSDDDHEAYLDLMAEWCAELDVQVWAYCLMPNHVHLIAVRASADGLGRGEPTGRPAGSEAFVALLEGLTGRRLERQKPGPKRAEGSYVCCPRNSPR